MIILFGYLTASFNSFQCKELEPVNRFLFKFFVPFIPNFHSFEIPSNHRNLNKTKSTNSWFVILPYRLSLKSLKFELNLDILIGLEIKQMNLSQNTLTIQIYTELESHLPLELNWSASVSRSMCAPFTFKTKLNKWTKLIQLNALSPSGLAFAIWWVRVPAANWKSFLFTFPDIYSVIRCRTSGAIRMTYRLQDKWLPLIGPFCLIWYRLRASRSSVHIQNTMRFLAQFVVLQIY